MATETETPAWIVPGTPVLAISGRDGQNVTQTEIAKVHKRYFTVAHRAYSDSRFSLDRQEARSGDVWSMHPLVVPIDSPQGSRSAGGCPTAAAGQSGSEGMLRLGAQTHPRKQAGRHRGAASRRRRLRGHGMANAAKLWESFDDILSHQERWNQEWYIGGKVNPNARDWTECGTTACIAGFRSLRDGLKLAVDENGLAESFVDEWGNCASPAEHAARVFELDLNERDVLFGNMTTDLGELKECIAEIIDGKHRADRKQCTQEIIAMVTRQQQLLDELDEARIVAKVCRRGWWLMTLAGFASLLMVLSGAVVGMWSTAARVDFGGQATLLVILGILGMISAGVFGCFWHDLNTTDYVNSSNGKTIPPPAARLRAAEREYRNHVMEQT